ncbi:MAG: glycosyltransferase [Deltaproteobacteria bacterium]|nr:glycosyltransferase [Deltaproteobacteria bacterium]
MRVALVHDWLTGMRGGEKVLEVFCELYPDADLHTLLHVKGSCSPTIERMHIKTSFIQHLPDLERSYRRYLPLFPHAIERFDFSRYDLVISSSHCVAKGVITPPHCTHVSYVHTPMRYVWDQYNEYFGPGRAGRLTRLAAAVTAPFLRAWDESSSLRVDRYIANSTHVAERIRKRYRREAHVIFPPVETARFKPVPAAQRDNFYLMVGAFAPYKRVDLAVEAFNRLGRPLKIVGSGQDAERIKKLAGPNIDLLGAVDDTQLVHLYARCKAFIFPGEEDAGITPLEAMASGRPVIAYGKGGVRDTVIPLEPGANTPTGIFFPRQSVEDFIDAVRRFEAAESRFDPAALRRHAEAFDRNQFKRRIEAHLRQDAGPMGPTSWSRRPALA